MTRIARTLGLSTFILLMSAIVGHIVNVLLAAVLSFPKASIYAPLDSVFTFVATSGFISDITRQPLPKALLEFMEIQVAIFVLLVFVSSHLALTKRHVRTVLDAILASAFVIPGVLIQKGSLSAYLAYRLPDVGVTSLRVEDLALQIALSMAFYSFLFFIGLSATGRS
jgi:hypothetical protein